MKNRKEKRKKILVSNDDGITAPGLAALSEALSRYAEVYVCAPDSQRSAFSHAITTGTVITVRKAECPGAVKALSCSGTPADSVRAGLNYFRNMDIEMDMVFSGINSGANLGDDTVYSGTVGAAMEGSLCRKAAVAVSVCAREPEDFSFAAALACRCLDMENGVLNINVPDIPGAEIKGIKLTGLGPREYTPWFETVEAGEEETVYRYGGRPAAFDDLPEDTDVRAVEEGWVSVTPLRYDNTDREALKRLRKEYEDEGR